ncbi:METHYLTHIORIBULOSE-1-PHOSPHATE DEHYDRATASE [Salix purpurea]|uniref:Probable bifunctional methylthioribulose-1-phosphate dehydratase/enolase-phosphatase E1 n=1 Tax=Salix purpurea TaxID=77065 RepID=A0A9Q0VS63_SALPP|nr:METHYLTHIORIBULOSE-1-PHOSPHATE DEHYDRATASE [Salix purpurea]
MAAAPPAVAVNAGGMAAAKVASQAYLESKAVKDTRELIADLCKQFYTLGWVSGTGGSITIKAHDDPIPKHQQLILMSPSGVQKERMEPEDMYVLATNGSILSSPSPKPYPYKPPKCSDCAPLFLKAYDMRNAGAVIHSHGIESCLVTMINPLSKEFRITHMEMIKGIQGHGYYDELVVPIIENTAYENELTDSLAKAIEAYPKTTAVLVRNHGIYIWGDTWISAKTQAECYHYLFDAAIKLHQMGLDWSTPNHGPIQNVKGVLGLNNNIFQIIWLQRCIVLDIEGTTTPITFVADVLFPYARDNVGRHLSATYDTAETQEDIKLLRAQVEDDLAQGVDGAISIPSDDAGKEEVVAALVANVETMIKADRKITALKQLQGHIWRTGYENNELEGVVYDDVPEALEKWNALGIKVYIYSSGSRLAQRLIFGNTKNGDLRKYLSGFFDTTVGNKKETRSYIEISESLGVDKPSDILFVTDVSQEALAAKGAGRKKILKAKLSNTIKSITKVEDLTDQAMKLGLNVFCSLKKISMHVTGYSRFGCDDFYQARKCTSSRESWVQDNHLFR